MALPSRLGQESSTGVMLVELDACYLDFHLLSSLKLVPFLM